MKYRAKISAEKDLGFSLDGYIAISIKNLLAANKEDYDGLVTMYFKDGKYKFSDVGIYSVEPLKALRDFFVIGWSAYSGDPTVSMSDLAEPIVCDTYHGEWSYTLLASEHLAIKLLGKSNEKS